MERVDYQPLIVQDLLNWTKHEEINLSPWYQRRSVWTAPQKAYLINTLFEQKPVPTLYFRHALDLELDKSIREVVDGQQRIRSIIEYVSDGFAARHPEHPKKVTYSKLTTAQKGAFRTTQLSGGWLLGATDPDVIEVFGRLNSVSKSLNSAEKRNSNFSGDFKQFCLREASARVSMWRDLGVFSASSIARMQEVEFVSDLVLNLLKGLSDYSGAKLDKLYAEHEDDFPQALGISRRLEACFSKIASVPKTTISDSIFSREPVFFSLAIVVDELGAKLQIKKLARALLEIDRRFNSDKPLSERPENDVAFYEACRASTQRIATRRIRHKYIKSFLA